MACATIILREEFSGHTTSGWWLHGIFEGLAALHRGLTDLTRHPCNIEIYN